MMSHPPLGWMLIDIGHPIRIYLLALRRKSSPRGGGCSAHPSDLIYYVLDSYFVLEIGDAMLN